MHASADERGLTLILRKPRRSRVSGDELPPWRPAGLDVCKEQKASITSVEVAPSRRIVKPNLTSENDKPARKAHDPSRGQQDDGNQGRRVVLGAVENTMQPSHLLRARHGDMRKQPALNNNKGWNKGTKAGVTLESDIPMYNAASASQERLYIVPAAARQSQRQRPPVAPRPPPPGWAVEELSILTPRGAKCLSPHSPSAAPPPVSEGAPGSEGIGSGGGPLELAALFEQGPGWRRSVSVEAGSRVQVVSRSASKGGSRAARHADTSDTPLR